jgi:hypothetical protein
MRSIKITFFLCLLSLFVTFNSITYNTLVSAEENTSIEKKFFFNDADFDDNTDLAPVSQEQFKFFVQALALSLLFASRKAIFRFKNTLPIRAPPIF